MESDGNSHRYQRDEQRALGITANRVHVRSLVGKLFLTIETLERWHGRPTAPRRSGRLVHIFSIEPCQVHEAMLGMSIKALRKCRAALELAWVKRKKVKFGGGAKFHSLVSPLPAVHLLQTSSSVFIIALRGIFTG